MPIRPEAASGANLVGSVARNNRERSSQQDFEIKPDRPRLGIPQIEPDHVVKAGPAPAVYLPKPRDSWLQFKHTTTMPVIVHLELILNWGPRANQRHFPA